MTHIQIGDTTPRRQFDADGEQLAFDFTFPIFQDDDLDVYVDQAQMVLDTDYSVTGAGESAGGTVTFFTAPAKWTGSLAIFSRSWSASKTCGAPGRSSSSSS